MTVYGGAQAGGYQHFREQATWFIDPVSGDDLNDGLGSGTAIKTHAELVRRWGPKPTLPQATTVNILDEIPSTDPVRIEARMNGDNALHYKGTPVTAGSGTLTSAPTNLVTATSVTEITDTGQTFTGLESLRFRRDSDNALGYIWRVPSSTEAQLGVIGTSIVTGNPIASNPSGNFAAVNLANSDAYTLDQIPELPLELVDVQNTDTSFLNPKRSVSFEDFVINQNGVGSSLRSDRWRNAIFKGCVFLRTYVSDSDFDLVSCECLGLKVFSSQVLLSGCNMFDAFGIGAGFSASQSVVRLANETMAGESALIQAARPAVAQVGVMGSVGSVIIVESTNASANNKDQSADGMAIDVTSTLILEGDFWGQLDGGGTGLNIQGKVYKVASAPDPSINDQGINIYGAIRTLDRIPYADGSSGSLYDVLNTFP